MKSINMTLFNKIRGVGLNGTYQRVGSLDQKSLLPDDCRVVHGVSPGYGDDKETAITTVLFGPPSYFLEGVPVQPEATMATGHRKWLESFPKVGRILSACKVSSDLGVVAGTVANLHARYGGVFVVETNGVGVWLKQALFDRVGVEVCSPVDVKGVGVADVFNRAWIMPEMETPYGWTDDECVVPLISDLMDYDPAKSTASTVMSLWLTTMAPVPVKKTSYEEVTTKGLPPLPDHSWVVPIPSGDGWGIKSINASTFEVTWCRGTPPDETPDDRIDAMARELDPVPEVLPLVPAGTRYSIQGKMVEYAEGDTLADKYGWSDRTKGDMTKAVGPCPPLPADSMFVSGLPFFYEDHPEAKSPQHYGQIAYEAYAGHTDWKSLVSGAALPQWDGLSEAIREAWAIAAHAVRTASHSEAP